jgi:chorismate-pyruvate lyase
MRATSRRRSVTRSIVAAAAFAGCLQVVAHAQAPPPWPDSFVARLEALALIQSLNAEILGSTSATLTLERWCRDHRLAAEPRVAARVISGEDQPLSAEQRQRLQVAGETVKYRRVRLSCGGHVLSEAENWYVPGRLTADINRLLETTDTPFGRAVQRLDPYRQTFEVRLLWSPLPDGWESAADPRQPCATSGALTIPDALFEHRAILYTRDHKPFSEVHEVYQRSVLAFPPPNSCD